MITQRYQTVKKGKRRNKEKKTNEKKEVKKRETENCLHNQQYITYTEFYYLHSMYVYYFIFMIYCIQNKAHFYLVIILTEIELSYCVIWSWRKFHVVEWTIDFPPNLSKLKLGTNNRLLLVEYCMSGWLKLILNFH